jgi:hypothetical protein
MRKTVAQVRDMMTKEQVSEYTGYDKSIITGAHRRGELRGEKPGQSLRSRVYFDRAEVDRWLDSLAENAS